MVKGYSPEFISNAAIHIKEEHGIAKAVEFLATATTGLNPVQLFAICEGKARLRRKIKGDIYVEWCESEPNNPETSNTPKAP